MTIEELQLENDKLNARLQKAITVFGEQKANITRLTEERDSANSEIEKLKTRISELEAKVKEAEENDTNFFEQLQDIELLKKTITGKEEDIKQLITEKEMMGEVIAEKDKSLEKSREVFKEQKSKIDKLTKSNETLSNNNEDLNVTVKRLNAEIANLNDTNNQLNDKIKEISESYAKANDSLSKAETTHKEQRASIDKLNKTVDKLKNDNETMKKDAQKKVNEYKANIVNQLKGWSSELESPFDLFQ